MAKLYDYEAFDGTVYEGLSIVDALKLKQEDEERAKRQQELQEQQASDAKLGPQISAGIHAYEAQQQQNSKGPQQPFQSMGNNSSSPMSAMSSTGPSQNTNPAPNVTVSRFGEDGFMESVNSAVEQQKRDTPSPFEGTPASDSLFSSLSSYQGNGASPMSAMQDTSWRPAPSAQEQRASADFLALTEGIPPETVRALNARFRMGELSPVQYQNELIKANEGMRKFKMTLEEEREKAKIKGEAKGNTPFNNFGQRVAFDTPENRQATVSKLTGLKEYLSLDDVQMQTMLNDINSGLAWDKTKQLDALVAKKLGLDYNVEQEYDLIDPRVKTNNAKITGAEQTEQSILTGTTIPGYKPIQGVRITPDSVKKVKDAAPLIENMNKITDEIMAKFEKKGYEFTGEDAAEYMANVRYLQMLAKSEPVFNLGVIAGPDLMLLEQVIPNPSSLKEGLKSNFLGSAKTRLTEFKKNLNNGATSQYRVHGFEPEVKKKENQPAQKPVNSGIGKTSPTEALGAVPQAKIDLAKQALSDPEATPSEKAQAMMILRNAGVQ